MSTWHYLNENDDDCWAGETMPEGGQRRILITGCSIKATPSIRHTETKSDVTCLKCLRRLVGREGGLWDKTISMRGRI